MGVYFGFSRTDTTKNVGFESHLLDKKMLQTTEELKFILGAQLKRGGQIGQNTTWVQAQRICVPQGVGVFFGGRGIEFFKRERGRVLATSRHTTDNITRWV